MTTLIDRHEPLLNKALKKIQDIKDIRAILQSVDPAYVTQVVEQLSQEYMAIMRELCASTNSIQPVVVPNALTSTVIN